MSEMHRADCLAAGGCRLAVRRDAGTARKAQPRRLAKACDRLGRAYRVRRRPCFRHPQISTERSRQSAALEAARTILAESSQVKEAATTTNCLKSLLD